MHDEPVPSPEPGEQLVRVTAVGLCGSDLHRFDEGGLGPTMLERPHVLGHELPGITTEGRRVALDPTISCGACEPCPREVLDQTLDSRAGSPQAA